MTYVDSPHTASIHFLDDDSLLNVFYLYRLLTLGEGQHDAIRIRGGVDGSANGGGLNSHMFAEDGETSYLGLHPIRASALFVHMARPWRTC